MLECYGLEFFKVSTQVYLWNFEISLSWPGAQGKNMKRIMNETWGWWCYGWDWLPMFSPPDQKDSPTEMSTSYILEHPRKKYFAKYSYFEFYEWTSNPNLLKFLVNILNEEWNKEVKQTLPEGRGWLLLASLQLVVECWTIPTCASLKHSNK